MSIESGSANIQSGSANIPSSSNKSLAQQNIKVFLGEEELGQIINPTHDDRGKIDPTLVSDKISLDGKLEEDLAAAANLYKTNETSSSYSQTTHEVNAPEGGKFNGIAKMFQRFGSGISSLGASFNKYLTSTALNVVSFLSVFSMTLNKNNKVIPDDASEKFIASQNHTNNNFRPMEFIANKLQMIFSKLSGERNKI
jgi:hypothetical protein